MSNLEQEIMEELSGQMQSEIDKEILWGMLVGLGWTRVLLPRFENRDHALDVLKWAEDNCQHPYERKGSEYIFENNVDAVNFFLKWK